MSRRRLLSPISLSGWTTRTLFLLSLTTASLIITTNGGAQGTIKVDESKTKIFLAQEPAEVHLAIQSSSNQKSPVQIHLEVIDPHNNVLAQLDRVEEITESRTVAISLPFSVSKLDSRQLRQLCWLRLRYSLTNQSTSSVLSQGILSFSEIAPELFELRLAHSLVAQEGNDYRVRVKAANPTSQQPLAGLTITGELTLEHDDRDIEIRASGHTDDSGYVLLTFPIPPRFPRLPHVLRPAGGEIKVTGRLGPLTAEADDSFMLDQSPKILLSTDKPIYQPGQTLHVRALILSRSSKVIANQTVGLQIYNDENVVVHQATVTTSRFGVVSSDWLIPRNIRLGSFTIVLTSSNSNADQLANTYVQVTRYELPNFAVNVRPDRRFYLPGQNAKVAVRADYLFGQPLSKAHVKVIRETDRSWNYREQKWDIEEEEKFEGETDATGTFTANIDLREQHQSITEDESERFKDLQYAAYVTDLSTNRTEQKRFDLRVSKQPIHVYLIHSDVYEDQKGRLPIRWFVTTSYADGSPAQCTVTLHITPDDEEDGIDVIARTNRDGLGRVPALRLPSTWEAGNVDVSLTARDRARKEGTGKVDVDTKAEGLLQIQTDKVLYRDGEPVLATISTNLDDGYVIVEIANEHELFQSTRLKLQRGQVQIRFPYSPKFKDKLTIAAYIDDNADDHVGVRTILYPHNRELNVGLQPSKTTYRPGEDAQVNLHAKAPNGTLSESALGVVVSDKAVDERALTTSKYLRNYLGSYQSFIDNAEISGITLNSIRRINMSTPVSPRLALAAEMILNRETVYWPEFDNSDSYETSQSQVFEDINKVTLLPLKEALTARYIKTDEYPREETSLRRILASSNVDLTQLRDPWGTTFQTSFYVNRENDCLLIRSAGPDKRFDTADDFNVEELSWRYFKPIGEAIDLAVSDYYRRNGNFIRDKQTLIDELHQRGVSDGQLLDPWRNPYQFKFGIASNSSVLVRSLGKYPEDFDDFTVWLNSFDYFAETRALIRTTLVRWTQDHPFPNNATEFEQVLRQAEISPSRLNDAWGRPYEARFRLQTLYVDKITTENAVGQSGKTTVTPITQVVRVISLNSLGVDGVRGTSDDFEVASFNGVISEHASSDAVWTQLVSAVVMTPNTGAIAGFVNDAQGAAVPGAKVVATGNSVKFEAVTDDNGGYIISDLPPGDYQVRVDASGFKAAIFEAVKVNNSAVTTVNAVLEPGASVETVMVTAAPETYVTPKQITELPLNGRNFSRLALLRPGVVKDRGNSVNLITKSGPTDDIFTPRLREYFPETLLWQPELTTDKKGRAQLKFKLADNITTWKLSVIGSNENGEVGSAETEIRAFQPFFAELDPPRVLTQGDRISLPVVLRNYLDHKQIVELVLKPEGWFSHLSPNRTRTIVNAGDSTRQFFDIRATTSIETGKQRVTAIGSDSSDAIEKTVTVHPDGEEKTETVSDILDSSTSLSMNIPRDVLDNSARTELKIYPNLMSHVWDSVEGIMQRPYGCTEQTISSSYPSLVTLKFMKNSERNAPLALKARRYLEDGYQKLRGYQAEDGGFTYWGRGSGDIALTAYALRFLREASDVIEVDQSIIDKAQKWLIEQQRNDGVWPAITWNGNQDLRRSALLTVLVTRSLASEMSAAKDAHIQVAVSRAFSYLKDRSQQFDEPYLIASYSLAASLMGQKEEAKIVNERLRKLAHSEAGMTYWQLETNTPFYGWGTAGRIETTALALQALLKEDAVDDSTIERSTLLFLLRRKDRYGVWYSTQATVNVLDALLSFLTKRPANQEESSSSSIAIIANNRLVKTVPTAADGKIVEPLVIDLSSVVKSGDNRVELRTSADNKTASVELVSRYYVPWSRSSEVGQVKSGDSEALRFEASFDRVDAKVMDEITCRVKAQRVGFSGYGMMLAEIGLPPGADVDRASLETAMKQSNWSLNQYEVLPDRVVVYLWPQAGGCEFSFKFRPRIAMTAKATASSVYDYYNPEARAVVAPTTFIVK